MNTDQGAQFTSDEFVATVLGAGSQINMDGKGARHYMGKYIKFYNSGRPHTALNDRTPDDVYFMPVGKAA